MGGIFDPSATLKASIGKRAAKSKNKFGAKKIEIDGVKFDSKREARRWQALRLELRGGAISNLERQVSYSIEVNGRLICKYIADFVYDRDGLTIVEDSKGHQTADFKLKRKLMQAVHGIDVLLT